MYETRYHSTIPFDLCHGPTRVRFLQKESLQYSMDRVTSFDRDAFVYSEKLDHGFVIVQENMDRNDWKMWIHSAHHYDYDLKNVFALLDIF